MKARQSNCLPITRLRAMRGGLPKASWWWTLAPLGCFAVGLILTPPGALAAPSPVAKAPSLAAKASSPAAKAPSPAAKASSPAAKGLPPEARTSVVREDVEVLDPGHRGLEVFFRRLACLPSNKDTAEKRAAGKGAEGRGAEGRRAEGRGAEGTEGKGTEGKGTEGKGTEGRGAEGRRAEGRGAEGAGVTKEEDRSPLVRIAHYGDSIIAGDRLSSAARQTLQEAFGDGGHGYLLLVPPTRWYHRAGVKTRASRFWSRASIQQDWMKGSRYGYGAAMVRTMATGAWVQLQPQPEGAMGGVASRLVVLFERSPHAGVLRVLRGGQELGLVRTRGDAHTGGRAVIRFSEGSGPLRVELAGGGPLHIHGVALEREGPGVVWDGLGLTGARYLTLARLPQAHFQEQLALRPADLVVFQYGGNDSDQRTLPEESYRAALRGILTRLRSLRPRLSCLVVGPLDRGFHWRRAWPSRPIVSDIERVQREEALAHGCAYFSAREVMGGEGGARRWARSRPPLIWGDLTHLRPAGASSVGRQLGRALVSAYTAWRRKNPGTRCATSPSGSTR